MRTCKQIHKTNKNIQVKVVYFDISIKQNLFSGDNQKAHIKIKDIR